MDGPSLRGCGSDTRWSLPVTEAGGNLAGGQSGAQAGSRCRVDVAGISVVVTDPEQDPCGCEGLVRGDTRSPRTEFWEPQHVHGQGDRKNQQAGEEAPADACRGLGAGGGGERGWALSPLALLPDFQAST